MDLFARVRCRCFEEGKLSPCPLPVEYLYIDRDDRFNSKKLDDAHARFTYRQFQARYGQLENAFIAWRNHPCQHELGNFCMMWVGGFDECGAFLEYCSEIGKNRLPVLSHIFPFGNGWAFPEDSQKAEDVKEALKELGYFDSWLVAKTKSSSANARIAETNEKMQGAVSVSSALRKLLKASLETGNPIRWC